MTTVTWFSVFKDQKIQRCTRLSPKSNKLLDNTNSVFEEPEERKSEGEMEFNIESDEEEEVFHVSYTADGAN